MAKYDKSEKWFGEKNLEGFLHRSGMKAQGWPDNMIKDRPIIGIANSFSEAVHCNSHLRNLAEHVKKGVIAAGGTPIEFPVISLGEFFLTPTSMYLRNQMSIDVEEMIKGLPIDGVVLLSGCDKTTPAMLMGAASANIPTILLPGGPSLRGDWKGQELGSCTDCRRFWTELRAGNITQDDYDSMEESIYRSPGHCMVAGTASTMSVISEAMGLTLKGAASIPAVDSRRLTLSNKTGQRIVEMVNENIKIENFLKKENFHNGISALMSFGGSTNAIIHMLAIAGRTDVNIDLDDFNTISEKTPVIVNLKPAGEMLMEDLNYAGGVSGILKNIEPDNKSQITFEYTNGKPTKVKSVVISSQHSPDISQSQVRDLLRPYMIKSIPKKFLEDFDDSELYINPTGNFVIGGPDGDTGLTGRKIIVDTYGGAAPHGGGAFSGKDPTKVDRSAAYAARYIAKNVVASKISEKCLIQIAYAIGGSKPLSIYVDLFDNDIEKNKFVVEKINDNFNLSPRGIREMLNLNKPIYEKTAAYGHFGRRPEENGSFSWEKTDKIKAFLK